MWLWSLPLTAWLRLRLQLGRLFRLRLDRRCRRLHRFQFGLDGDVALKHQQLSTRPMVVCYGRERNVGERIGRSRRDRLRVGRDRGWHQKCRLGLRRLQRHGAARLPPVRADLALVLALAGQAEAPPPTQSAPGASLQVNTHAISSALHADTALALMLADPSTAALSAHVLRMSMLAMALHDIPARADVHASAQAQR